MKPAPAKPTSPKSAGTWRGIDSRAPDAAQRPQDRASRDSDDALQSRGPRSHAPASLGPGSAEQRKGAAPRPGHAPSPPPHGALDLAVRLVGRQEHVVVVVEPEGREIDRDEMHVRASHAD